MIRVKKGVTLPIAGAAPSADIGVAKPVKTVAIVGSDYVGMKPSLDVAVGDTVKIGQSLFTDKKNEGVVFTSPAGGVVKEINRGARRVFQSLVIEVASNEEHVSFKSFKQGGASLAREEIVALMVEAGLWPALRSRPFSRTPGIDQVPKALFITAMDTNPLAPEPTAVMKHDLDDFVSGAEILSKLTEGNTYVCKKMGRHLNLPQKPKIVVEEFDGPHPAGNVGTHIHFLDPVSEHKTVWHINYADVIMVGKLFKTGKLFLDKVISLAGPQAKKPRLLKTRLGANVKELVEGEVADEETRVISGSVFNGRTLKGPFSYLGRYHHQISLIKEGAEREFLGWHMPGADKFSIKNVFVAAALPKRELPITASTHGGVRAMVPSGMYEKVMPLDILPTQLLRALITENTDLAISLGALELDEEDLALCTFVDTGKVDYATILRDNLTTIEQEG